MKKRISSILCALLAMLMFVTVFASCNNKKEPTGDKTTEGSQSDQSTGSGEPETTGTAADNTGLELRDFNNGVMKVWYSSGKSTWSPWPLQVSDEESASGDVVYKAGYDRNKKLEKDLNLSIEYTISPSNPNGTNDAGEVATLRNMQHDVGQYDLFLVGAYTSGVLAAEGWWYDLTKSDYIHPDAYYYETQMNEQVRLKGRQYFASGFYTIQNTAAVDCTYVNMAALRGINPDIAKQDLYDLAFDNKWTISTLLSLGEAYATPDTNVAATYKATLENVTTDNNRFSLVLSRNYCMNIYHALGGETISYNENSGEYELGYRSTANIDLCTWIQEHLTGNRSVGMIISDKHTDAFVAGAAPFMVVTLNNLTKVKAGGMEYIILPTPLMKEGDDYRAFSARWNLNFAAIPATASDMDKATYLYEMFMAYSYDVVYPAYYTQYFGTTYVPDEASSRVFDLVAHSRVVDPVEIYGLYGTRNPQHIVMSTNNAIDSTTETIVNEVSAKLAKFLEGIK